MSAGYRFLIRFNGYPLSAVIAVMLHGLTLAFIVYWNSSSDSSEFELVQPTVIKALFIDENPQLRERQRQVQQQRRLEEDRQRQQQQQREQEEERQRQAEAERLRRQQLEQQRLLDEEERQRLLELERQRQAELDREQEQQRQRELAEQQRRQDEAERRRQQEEAEAAAARTEYEVVQSGVALIQQFVQEVWNRPPSARNGMRTVLRISMLPTGEVTDVAVIESSGDAAFDRSAENAVYSAQPFSELEQMPINIFNDNFRILSLIFQPEDLLN